MSGTDLKRCHLGKFQLTKDYKKQAIADSLYRLLFCSKGSFPQRESCFFACDLLKLENMKFWLMKKRWIFLLVFIFLLGVLLGWGLEVGGLLNYGARDPIMEDLKTRLWPFRFWDYLY